MGFSSKKWCPNKCTRCSVPQQLRAQISRSTLPFDGAWHQSRLHLPCQAVKAVETTQIMSSQYFTQLHLQRKFYSQSGTAQVEERSRMLVILSIVQQHVTHQNKYITKNSWRNQCRTTILIVTCGIKRSLISQWWYISPISNKVEKHWH